MQAKRSPSGSDAKMTKLQKLKDALSKIPESSVVTVLPDYFVDRFVRLDNFAELAKAVEEKGEEGGGGSIRGIRQTEVKGGNAVNLAYALCTLKMKTNLITIANSLPAEMLRIVFGKFPHVNLDIINGDPGFTVAFEFRKNNRIVNVMVSDSGALKDFDQTWLKEKHWTDISNSGLVCLVNWSSIIRATDLTESVFTFAREKGIETFFDPA
ncbi:MAG TPA: hypothetical protein VED17_07020, partial [Nitrososphaerales archaeon]|nr:hypothetical protein [Nitrososphaerales archaeon]